MNSGIFIHDKDFFDCRFWTCGILAVYDMMGTKQILHEKPFKPYTSYVPTIHLSQRHGFATWKSMAISIILCSFQKLGASSWPSTLHSAIIIIFFCNPTTKKHNKFKPWKRMEQDGMCTVDVCPFIHCQIANAPANLSQEADLEPWTVIDPSKTHRCNRDHPHT